MESREFGEKLLCCRLWILKIVELSVSLVLSALIRAQGTRRDIAFHSKKSARAAGAWAVPLREENMVLMHNDIYIYIYTRVLCSSQAGPVCSGWLAWFIVYCCLITQGITSCDRGLWDLLRKGFPSPAPLFVLVGDSACCCFCHLLLLSMLVSCCYVMD